ncbi:MAG: AAA family ATPase, partial [Opitutaceae bacterium]|nr:AAA family ATPase [Opitutaceae bacterium]
MRILEQITIRNFKSIREQTLNLGAINVFIGQNGAGKSNLIGAFSFLLEIINQNLSIKDYTAARGGADNLLYYGRRVSERMSFDIRLAPLMNLIPATSHSIQLKGTDENGLFVENERIRELFALSQRLEDVRAYHFHDTTATAPTRGTCDVEDNRFLRPHGENLAAFLYWLQERKPDHFSNIQDAIRQIAPFFGRFRLAPLRLNESKIRLEWAEKSSDAYFSATSLSDGTL